MEAVCLPIGSEFRVDVYDAFGDGMCGSCYGGVDVIQYLSTKIGHEQISIDPSGLYGLMVYRV